MLITQKHLDQLTYRILGCAIEVHKQLGPGLLESVYERCFVHELSLRGLSFETQCCVPLCKITPRPVYVKSYVPIVPMW